MSRKRNGRNRATQRNKRGSARPAVNNTPLASPEETAALPLENDAPAMAVEEVEEGTYTEDVESPLDAPASFLTSPKAEPFPVEVEGTPVEYPAPAVAAEEVGEDDADVMPPESSATDEATPEAEEVAAPAEVEEVTEVSEGEEILVDEEEDDFDEDADDLREDDVSEDDEGIIEEAASLPKSRYEQDDEEFVGSDKVIHEEKNLAIVQQMDNVVSWEIVNFYKENGKVPNKFVMRNNPPIFKVASQDGAAAEFLVTKELALTLEKIFSDVGKAYYGIDPTTKKAFSQKSLKEKTNGAVDWVKENPFKAVLGLLFLAFIFLSPILY